MDPWVARSKALNYVSKLIGPILCQVAFCLFLRAEQHVSFAFRGTRVRKRDDNISA